MTYRKSKWHLEFESLEAKELLSSVEIAVIHAGPPDQAAQIHRASKASVADVALSLSGTVKGTYRVTGGGSGARFTGRGLVSPIGKSQVNGSIALGASSGGGQFTFNFGRRGKVVAAITGQTPGGGYVYQITGGTRSFAGDTGAGTSVVQILSSNAAHTRGGFALSLQSASST